MQVENKSAEKDYTFDLDKAFINGLQYDLYMSVDVAPGKKAIEEIDVFGSYLERMKSEGCEQLSDIELCFAVHEMDNFDDEHMMSGSAHVYPYGKDQAMAFDRPSLSSDVVLVDNAPSRQTPLISFIPFPQSFSLRLIVPYSREFVNLRLDNFPTLVI